MQRSPRCTIRNSLCCLRAGWLLCLAATLVGACTWQPIAREVEPEQVMLGPSRVLRVIDQAGRYALIQNGVGDAERQRILELESRESCELPAKAEVIWFAPPLLAPKLRGKDAREFLLALIRPDDAGTPLLYYADEHCELRGPFGATVSNRFSTLQLRSDGRDVSLVSSPSGSLTLVDPWSGQSTKIADEVGSYQSVQRSDSSSAPEALWLTEGTEGKVRLTQRALDGTLLLALGSNVTGKFDQTQRDALRVSFTDNGNLYEAKGPDFTPVLIAEDACEPSYSGSSLDLWTPCADRQLVRIDLTTGVVRRFAPRVYRSDSTGEVTIELVHDDPNEPDRYNVWVSLGTTGTTPRFPLLPRPNSGVNVISRQRLVGLSVNGQLGTWSLDGKFSAGFQSIRSLQTFRDQRTQQLLWLIVYDVDENEIGTIGVIDQSELERAIEARQASSADAGLPDGGTSRPSAIPLKIAERAWLRGYQVYYPAAVHEPVILSLEPPMVDVGDTKTGTLNAHLLSAERSTHVDDGVQSFEVVASPVPGILYGIIEGPRAGLWFAAL